MKTKIMSVILIILLVIGVTIFGNYKWFYTRFYAGNRVEGVYSVTVEGKSVAIEMLGYTLDGNEVKHEYDEDEFSIRKGYYGLHNIRFVIDNRNLYELTGDEYFNNDEKTTVGIDYFNTNWWHIIKLDIRFNLIKKDDGWFVEQDVKDNLYPFDEEWYEWDCEDVPLGEFVQLGP